MSEQTWPKRHGLYYVSRDDETIYILDKRITPQVDRPERDVLKALIAYASDWLNESGNTP